MSTTLAPRGAQLASGSMRDTFGAILNDQYDANTNPSGFVNIGTAENYIMQPIMSEFTNSHFSSTAKEFSYGEGPWGTKKLRQGMAKHMNRYFKPVVEVKESDLLFANGVTSLCELLGFTIAEPGDAILLSRPIYQAFQMDFGLKAKLKCVGTSFGQVDQFSTEGVACYERTLMQAEEEGTKIRALLLCHPHNPLGQCYPKETIVELMKLCQKYHIHFVSDEIYALSVYEIPGDKDTVPFQSVLSFDSSEYIDKDYLHVLYGFSKDFAAGGLRIGCLYTRNQELWKAISGVSVFHGIGAADQNIAAQILDDANQEWLDEFFATSQKRLADRNQLTRSLLQKKGINFHKGANAGFFIWCDLRPYLEGTGKDGWEAEEELVKRMFSKKVFITDGKSMDAEEPGWFRIIFSQEENVIKEGLRRVFEAVGASCGIE